ncbi:MAG: LPXTG cell wall anchor domain-containing protein [Acidimicrobiia bacterium]|nr:LPXTG cell wall anchor domain-containing protein [Acidimicrobiia bacterium]
MVERQDIEAKAREIAKVVDDTRETAQNTAVMVGAGVLILLLLAFFLGRKKGNKSRAVVEVYRV